MAVGGNALKWTKEKIDVLSLLSDYGYHRPSGQDKCVEQPNFEGPEIDVCFRGHEEKVISEGWVDEF